MAKRTFTVRLSPETLRSLQIKAQKARMGRGQYITQLIMYGYISRVQHEMS